MKSETQSQGFTVKEGRTYLTTPGGTVFVSPEVTGTDAQVRIALARNGLDMAAFEQNVDLFYTALQTPKEKHPAHILDLTRREWLRPSNRLDSTVEKIYHQERPEVDENYQVLDLTIDQLDELVDQGQAEVINYGFKTGRQTPSDLVENGLVRLLAGDKINQIGEIARQLEYDPLVTSYSSDDFDGDEVITTTPSLLADRFGNWLNVGGDIRLGRGGYAFGVAPESASAEN